MLITCYTHMLLQQYETSICLISQQSLINISNREPWNELQKRDCREQVSNYHVITHQPYWYICRPTVALTMIEWAVYLSTHYTISNWDKSQSFAAGGCNRKDLSDCDLKQSLWNYKAIPEELLDRSIQLNWNKVISVTLARYWEVWYWHLVA